MIKKYLRYVAMVDTVDHTPRGWIKMPPIDSNDFGIFHDACYFRLRNLC